jgi:hypothetical protein
VTWEIQYGLFLILSVVAFGAYGAWKTRDRGGW